MTTIQQARDIVAAHYDAKGWKTRAAMFRAGAIKCADDVDLVVRAIEAERERCAVVADDLTDPSGHGPDISGKIRGEW